mmetsp:Transcript_11058/g.39040  ORF Transcript_11058/g.39040 Transcript_11058/m.39040 type:complete len:288 (-) Transcript_11058:110-973(-)
MHESERVTVQKKAPNKDFGGDRPVLAKVPSLDDLIAGFEVPDLHGIADQHPLVVLEALQAGHLSQEAQALLHLLPGRILHKVIEGVAVNRPQRRVRVRLDSGRTGGVVEQREVSEVLAGDGVGENGLLDARLEDVELPALDDIQRRLRGRHGSALLNDRLASNSRRLLEGVDNHLQLRLVQDGEHEALAQGLPQSRFLLLGLLEDRGLPVLVHLGPLGADSHSRALGLGLGHVFLELRVVHDVVLVLILLVVVGPFLLLGRLSRGGRSGLLVFFLRAGPAAHFSTSS